MGKIISVFSPKGGVGKTNIAIHTAYVGRKSLEKVALIELDFSPGDLAFIFDKDPNAGNIERAYQDIDNYQGYMFQTEGGYHVLLGTLPDRGERIEGKPLIDLLNRIKEDFDLVVIDLQPGLTTTVVDAVNSSDECLLILNDEISVLGRGNSILDYLDLNRFANLDHMKMVINMQKNKLPYNKLNIFNIPIISVIPHYGLKFRNGEINKKMEEKIVDILADIIPEKIYSKKKKILGVF